MKQLDLVRVTELQTNRVMVANLTYSYDELHFQKCFYYFFFVSRLKFSNETNVLKETEMALLIFCCFLVFGPYMYSVIFR